MKLLLDTCTFLWIAEGEPKLSRAAAKLFTDSGNEAFLSPASAWEIAVKYAAGRLKLAMPPSRYVPEGRVRHGIAAFPLDESAALALDRLPALHRDPFDRLLICQALMGGMTILTPDELIRQYPVPTAW